MFEHIETKQIPKNTQQRKAVQQVQKKAAVPNKAAPVQFKLNKKDIDGINNSGVDSKILLEFNWIYSNNSDYINYGKSSKEGHAALERGNLTAVIKDTRPWVLESKTNAILRQSMIIHEVTHLAVINYNQYQNEDLRAIQTPSNEAELIRLSTPETEKKEVVKKLETLTGAVEAEKKSLSEFKYKFSNSDNDFYSYVMSRLGYVAIMLQKSTLEYPSVINELNFLFAVINDGEYKNCSPAVLLRQYAEQSLLDRKLKRD